MVEAVRKPLAESGICESCGNFLPCPNCAQGEGKKNSGRPNLEIIKGGLEEKIEEFESEPALSFDMSEYSEKGEKHNTNEDSSFIDQDNGTAGIFDGMGGHAAGNVASEIASRSIRESLAAIPKGSDMETTIRYMKNAFDNANSAIMEEARRNPDYDGMGTTASFVKFYDGPEGRKAIVVNAGDSRVYRKRGSEMKAVTKDDGLVQMIVDSGALADDQDVNQLLPDAWQKKLSRMFKKENLTVRDIRNIVSNGLGNSSAEARVFIEDIQDGDEFIITSDGIHDPLLDNEISSSKSAEDLVKKAKERGKDPKNARRKDDDSTAVTIKVSEAIEIDMDDVQLIDDEEGYTELTEADIEEVADAK